MKKIAFLCLVFAMHYALAQNETVNLEKLKAPSSPAASIIGIQPSDINRPKSVKELETAIYNNFVSENSLVFPDDFGLEMMPYWIFNQKNIDERDYLSQETFNGMYSNLSVSIASTQNYMISDSVKTNAMGFGLRTMLYKSKLTDEKNKIASTIYFNRISNLIITLAQLSLENYIGDFSDFDKVAASIANKLKSDETFSAIVDQENWYGSIKPKNVEVIVDDLISELKLNKDELKTLDNWDDAIGKARKTLKEKYDSISLEKELTDYLTNRKGFQLELASSLSLNFPTNDFNYSIVPRWGVWLTATYQHKENANFQYLGILRYLRNDLDFYSKYNVTDTINYSNSFDFGFKLVILPSKDFTTELEYVGRYRSTSVVLYEIGNTKVKSITDDFISKWMLNFNYQINENMLITYSFGKDFDPIVKMNNNIISTIGLNIGFGNPIDAKD